MQYLLTKVFLFLEILAIVLTKNDPSISDNDNSTAIIYWSSLNDTQFEQNMIDFNEKYDVNSLIHVEIYLDNCSLTSLHGLYIL